MKIRTILIILCLLAVLSASIGGYLYYASLTESAYKEVERQSISRAENIKNHVTLFLYGNLKSVKAMAGLGELRRVLEGSHDPAALAKGNEILDHYRHALKVDVCYLMNREGDTIASSNRNEPHSFVGENYGFRPYFQRAIEGGTAVYMALGVTSKKRGVYYSHPVYGKKERAPLGVAVIKATVEPIENEFKRVEEGIVLLADPDGVVFVSNKTGWLYHLLWDLPKEDIARIASSRQFGRGPWPWTGLKRKGKSKTVDPAGNEYFLVELTVENYPGWHLLYLADAKTLFRRVSSPLFRLSGTVITVLCILIGLSAFFLYRKASLEIQKRIQVENALRESEETAMALLNAPTENALLLDTAGTILALNEPAAQALGKSVKAMIGSCIFDSFRPETASRERAKLDQVIRSGHPLRYEDRRGSRFFDTNVFPVFDPEGKVVRVAIFSRDITERREAEQALKKAKEELSLYSRELERQVRERTREITGILENTPAVVFIKDRELKYVMVGSRFESLFGFNNREIKGKTDYDVFPKEIAEQFRLNDRTVLNEKQSIQVEENVPLDDGLHTYLSVKFPLFDEQGQARAMCGIATDITAIKRAQNQLRRLSARIMDSQEKERTAIARELHDELGQMLTALRMEAAWIRDRLVETEPRIARRARNMCDLIEETIDEVRGIAIRLRPGVLDDLGLIDALEWYTTEFEKRSGIACIFNHFNIPHLKDMIATAAYRIAQEALTNVARHSFATHVDVDLRMDNHILILAVVDNGGGFNTLRVSDGDCMGIAGMRERAGLVGGSLEIESNPGAGTKVYFRVPVNGYGGTAS